MTLFNAGEELIDAKLNALNEPGWSSFGSIAWSSSGTQPALGNGTLVGRYRQTVDSDLVIFEFRLVMGSTTTYGTGTYFFSAPVTPSSIATTNASGYCYFLDAGTQDKIGGLKFEDNTKVTPVGATGGVVTPTNPHTWANTDQIKGTILYEPA